MLEQSSALLPTPLYMLQISQMLLFPVVAPIARLKADSMLVGIATGMAGKSYHFSEALASFSAKTDYL